MFFAFRGLSVESSGQYFGKFDQIAERVGEESELSANGVQDKRLGDDHDTTRAKLSDRPLHAGEKRGQPEEPVGDRFSSTKNQELTNHRVPVSC